MIDSEKHEDYHTLEFSYGKRYKQFLAFIIIFAMCCLVTLPLIRSSKLDKVIDIDNSSMINEMANGKSNSFVENTADIFKTSKQHESNTTSLFHRIDTTPEKTGKLPFLKNYRNPCWNETFNDSNKTRIRCLPYFYLVGAPKCGTTDLFRRLTRHPHISRRNKKENHWLTRKRYIEARRQNLSSYLEYYDDAVNKDISKVDENNYHPMIIGDGSASTLWDNRKLLKYHKDKEMKLPPFTNADILKRLNPNSKIIIMLRNPVTRLYSEYLFFEEGDWKGAEEFHKQVVSSLYYVKDCLRRYTVRYCTYFIEPALRVQVGFYNIFIEDYFRAFPRDQIKIIKLEEYSQNIDEAMNDVVSFLGLNKPSEENMTRIIKKRQAKARGEEDKKLGDMFPKTRSLLADFYRPWNEKLVQLLGEKYRYSLRGDN